MGRCGRNRSKELGVETGVLIVIMSINDQIFMLKRARAQCEKIDASK